MKTAVAAREGRYFYLATASLSVLGYHHDLDEPVIHLWNDAGIDRAFASHFLAEHHPRRI